MNLGYACLNVGLNQKGISSSKGMVRRPFWREDYNMLHNLPPTKCARDIKNCGMEWAT